MANRKIDHGASKGYFYAGDVAIVTDAADQDNTLTTALGVDLGSCNTVIAVLNVTAVTAGAASDTLDVVLQSTHNPYDTTVTWYDVVYFSQVSLNALSVPHNVGALILSTAITPTNFGTALTAGQVRHAPGVQYRIKYTVVDAAGTDLRVTFAVKLLAR